MTNRGAFAAAGAEEQDGGEPPPLAGGGVVVCLMGEGEHPERLHRPDRGFAPYWTPAIVRRCHADTFGFLRPWNEVPALMGSTPPARPPSTGTGVVTS
jgi:hypothetical protein